MICRTKTNHRELNTDFLDPAPLPPRWAAAAARSHGSDHGLKNEAEAPEGTKALTWYNDV